MLPTNTDVARRDRLMSEAAAMLRVHVPDRAGFCLGCEQAWARLLPHGDCPQMIYARRVMETLGAADRDWSLPDKLWPRHTEPRHTVPRQTEPRPDTPQHATPQHATPRHAAPVRRAA